MSNTSKSKTIGSLAKIYLVDFIPNPVIAKVDTGAGISSIWACQVHEKDDKLCFKLFGPSSSYYTGEEICIPKEQYRHTRIKNSFGHVEQRYVIKMRVKIADRKIQGTFTLANRSRQTYPILIGRRLIRGKFVVDVSKEVRPIKYNQNPNQSDKLGTYAP